jgi:hypothetical protein
MARRRKPKPKNRRLAVTVSRELAWDAKVAAMREGRVERSNIVSPNRRAANAKRACRRRVDW